MKARISAATFVGMSVAGAGIILELAEQVS
jgi:hypothetical protein